MPLEIEAKMSVPDFAAPLRRLKSAGAKPIGERMETNIFFDTPDASLRRADKGLRLRTHRDVSTGRVEHVVTFKGPRRPGPLKSRPEFEFTVTDPAAVRQMFKGLGLEISIIFKKRRQSWKLKGCRVELDTLPALGRFIEIEGPRPQSIMIVRRILGMEKSPMIRESYAALIAARRCVLSP
jgi:predicted adenylyl cyclase CyaB